MAGGRLSYYGCKPSTAMSFVTSTIFSYHDSYHGFNFGTPKFQGNTQVLIPLKMTADSPHRDRWLGHGVTRLYCTVIGHDDSIFSSFFMFFPLVFCPLLRNGLSPASRYTSNSSLLLPVVQPILASLRSNGTPIAGSPD